MDNRTDETLVRLAGRMSQNPPILAVMRDHLIPSHLIYSAMASCRIASSQLRADWCMGEDSFAPSLLLSLLGDMMKLPKTEPTLPEVSDTSETNVQHRDATRKVWLPGLIGPVRLFNSFDLQAIVFSVAFLLVCSRRPDAVLNAQFFAEDGKDWFLDAYNHGLRSLFIPESGYLHLLHRIIALFAVLLPFALAPLVMNLCAIVVQILPVNLFLTSRFNYIPLKMRLLGSLLYLAIPNAAEIHANVTNVQWHLALMAFLVLLARPASGWEWRIFDGIVLVLTTLSSPIGMVLVPMAAFLWWKRRQRWSLLTLALLIPGTLVVGYIALLTHDRQVAPNGPTFSRFAAILGRQVFLSSLLGRTTQDWLMQLRYVHLFEWIATVVGLAVLLYALRYGQMELKIFVLFAYAAFALGLARPLAGLPFRPQWEWLCVPGCGNRYYFLPMLAFLACLLWMATRKASPLAIRCFAVVLLLLMPIGIYRDWKYPPFADLHFPQYADQFEQASPGTTIIIPINPSPDWNMPLTKH
jgi:hypothetical protein